MSEKRCSKCESLKPVAEFHRKSDTSDGYRDHCKQCRSAYETPQWYKRNKAAINRRAAEWRASHRERNLEYLRRWALTYPDRKRQGDHLSYLKHKEKRQEFERTPARRLHNSQNGKNQRAARLARKGAAVEAITVSQWSDVKSSYANMCAYCLDRPVILTMDHVQPLASGGEHVLENIVPSCKSCNCSKSKRSLLMFLVDRRSEQMATGGV